MAQDIEAPKWNADEYTIETAAKDQQFLDDCYGGSAENMRKAIKEKTRYSIAYSDIEEYGTIFPQHRDEAYGLIEKYMGYTPNYAVYVPNETLLRKAIECRIRHTKDGYTQKMYEDDIYQFIRYIRNEDMRKDRWTEDLELTEKDYNIYNTTLMPYISHARNRLAGFLGYYPDLKFSLYAEVYLRSFLARDSFNPKWPPTPGDYKAMTIVKFREVLIPHGIEAANKSPLLGLHI